MRFRMLHCVCFLGMLAAAPVHAGGELGVFDAWIDAASADGVTWDGYATLKNTGDAPVVILTVQSDGFRMTSLHESAGARTRELHRVVIAPGDTLQLAREGRHLVLRHPREPVVKGARVSVRFLLADGQRVETWFDVTAAD